jgi:ATP-dependent Clp endopeptidase proteolytic subunit ClpP
MAMNIESRRSLFLASAATANVEQKKPRQWFQMKAESAEVGEIMIYDEIGQSWWNDNAVSATAFDTSLKALGDVKEIKLRINSPGGNVYDGVAIFNMLDQHPAKVTAFIDGIAASAASLVAMAADEIIMPKNSFMLIHEPIGITMGTADDHERSMGDLRRMEETFARTYADRSGSEMEDARALMKEDRLMTAEEAMDMGYADRIDDPVKNMTACYSFDRLPEKAREAMTMTGYRPAIEQAPPKRGKKTPQQEPAKVVSIDDARKDAMAYAVEVTELCRLANRAHMAAKFLKDQTSVADVRNKLMTLRAAADDRAEIQPQLATVDTGVTAKEQIAHSWKEVTDAVNARMATAAK